MQTKKLNKKAHQLSTILIVIVLIISVFSIGFYTESNGLINNIQNNENEITGYVGMESVTGFAVDCSKISSITANSMLWEKLDGCIFKGKIGESTVTGILKETDKFQIVSSEIKEIKKDSIFTPTLTQTPGTPPTPKTYSYTITRDGQTERIELKDATTKSQAESKVNQLKQQLKDAKGVKIDGPFEQGTYIPGAQPQKPFDLGDGKSYGVINDVGRLETFIGENALDAANQRYDKLNEKFRDKQDIQQKWQQFFNQNKDKGRNTEDLKKDFIDIETDIDKDLAREVLKIPLPSEQQAGTKPKIVEPKQMVDSSGSTIDKWIVSGQRFDKIDEAYTKANELNAKTQGYSTTGFFTIDNKPILKKGSELYTTKTNELGYTEVTGNEVKKPVKIGDVTFEEFYAFSDNKINNDKVLRVRVVKGTNELAKNVPVESYEEIKTAAANAKKDSLKFEEGDFTESNPFKVLDEDGTKLEIYKASQNFRNVDVEFTISKKNFVKIDGDIKPLEIIRVGKNGALRIVEKNEVIEIDTGQKNAKGEPTKKRIIEVKEYVGVDNEGNERFIREMLKNEKGRQTGEYIEDVTNLKTGEPKFSVVAIGQTGRFRIEYRDDGVYVNNKKYEEFIKEYENNPDLIKLVSSRRFSHAQYTSRLWFGYAESILTDFKGLGYYATLFFDKEDLDKWRETVDETFATFYLGTEYWNSEICSTYTDRQQEGVAYVDTKLGLAAVAAHIEATRSEEFLSPPETIDKTGIITPKREFLYKITFNVKNGDYDTDPKALEVLRFNVALKGEKEATLFKKDIELEKGDQFGHTGKNAIVQFSNSFYEEICIEFEDTPNSWNLDDDELCNTISGPSGPTSIGSGQPQTQQQQQSEGEGNVNDI